MQRPWGGRGIKVARVTKAELEKSVIVTDGIGEIMWSQVIQDFVSHNVEFGFILDSGSS